MFSFYVFLSGVFLLLAVRAWLNRHKLPLPPGPTRYPVIGSILSFPTSRIWLDFAKHKEEYGPVSCMTVLGQTFVVLNDREAVFELLEGRSSIYSGRPNPTFATMIGATDNFSLLQYGPEYKYQRKIVQQAFGSANAVARMRPVVEFYMRQFLVKTLAEPDKLLEVLRTTVGAIVLKVTYGYSIQTNGQDPLVQEVEAAMKVFTQAMQPATWLVDFLPFLRHIPEWMPGSGFKQIAEKWHKQIDQFVERPYQFVKQQMAAGTAAPSYTSALLDLCPGGPNSHEEFAFMRSASTMYGAGSDTTLSTLHSFFLAMVIHPSIQKFAQEEIDHVIGSERLPTSADRPNLPYVEAVFKEVLRWHTVVPLGVPHVVMEDDVYNGCLIPKGSTILPNIYRLNHDPEVYPDPFKFNPSRFLGPCPQPSPSETTFGFGRRLCAGKRLAEMSVFTAIVMSLATLHLGRARDKKGAEIVPVYRPDETTNDLITHPQPFKCSISPRSERARELIMRAEEEYDFSHNDAEAIRAISLEGSPWQLASKR